MTTEKRLLKDKVRVLRVLEYIGDREAVESCLLGRVVKGSKSTPRITINDAIIGEFPEILDRYNSQALPNKGTNDQER